MNMWACSNHHCCAYETDGEKELAVRKWLHSVADSNFVRCVVLTEDAELYKACAQLLLAAADSANSSLQPNQQQLTWLTTNTSSSSSSSSCIHATVHSACEALLGILDAATSENAVIAVIDAEMLAKSACPDLVHTTAAQISALLAGQDPSARVLCVFPDDLLTVRVMRLHGSCDVFGSGWGPEHKDAAAAAAADNAPSESFHGFDLAQITHELRTPLQAIMGFSDLALLLSHEHLPQEARGYMTHVKHAAKMLKSIVDDVLDLSKLRSGHMPIHSEPFQLREQVLDQVEANSAVLIKTKHKRPSKHVRVKLKVSIDEQLPNVLDGDSLRLVQVLLNLTSNAIKFTTEGFVEIGARLVPDTDSTEVLSLNTLKPSHESTQEAQERVVVQFWVRDTGAGIAEDKLEKIFLPYHQASRFTTRTHGGTGLGLGIAKALVSAQGGTMSVKSELGVGSVFEFTIPFGVIGGSVSDMETESPHPRGDDDLAQSEGKGNKVCTVLVAEDNRVNRRLISSILKRGGFHVHVVKDGLELLKIYKQSLREGSIMQVDVILTDMYMPQLGGIEAAIKVRELEATVGADRVPIILQTSDHTVVDASDNLDVTMDRSDPNLTSAKLLDGFVLKPVSGPTILREIRRAIASVGSLVSSRQLHATTDDEGDSESGSSRKYSLERASSRNSDSSSMSSLSDVHARVPLLLDLANKPIADLAPSSEGQSHPHTVTLQHRLVSQIARKKQFQSIHDTSSPTSSSSEISSPDSDFMARSPSLFTRDFRME